MDQTIPKEEVIPHKILILLKAEVNEVLPSGKINSRPINPKSHLFTLDSNSKEEARLILDNLFTEIAKHVKTTKETLKQTEC